MYQDKYILKAVLGNIRYEANNENYVAQGPYKWEYVNYYMV
ncbi:hypothetical protein C7972_107198 [Arenibacter sp. ARW7G5Y1]|nr:hypothetical protein C7972_107198 [Arenibacter sp. ARW7G5Y1]